MTQTRRHFIGSAGSVVTVAVLAPGALAGGRTRVVRQAAQLPAPIQWSAYQSQIYLAGVNGKVPKFTTNLVELEDAAAEALDAPARRDLLASAGGRATVRANARAFGRWKIVPLMFRDHAVRDLSATVLGTRMTGPVILAPVPRQGRFHPEGELATARAAAALGLVYTQSARATRSLEAVAAASGTGPRWFHMAWPGGERDLAALPRVAAAGYTHLVVDRPPAGRGFKLLAAIRRQWDGPIVLRGVRSAQGARAARKRGFDGIVVSNHDARRTDGVTGTIDALPAIRKAVGGRMAILFESGIRSAPDAYKALALGADAVLIGRQYAYGLALDGQAGVTQVLRTLLAELDFSIANAGYKSHRQLRRDSLARTG